MRYFYIIFFLFTSLPWFTLKAQRSDVPEYQDKPLRVEIPARSSNETYRIIPCGAAGVILFFRSQEATDEAHVNWYFSFFDTNMQQTWVKSIPLLNDQEYRFQETSRDTVAVLFVSGGKSRTADNEFAILRIINKTGTFVLNKGKIPENTEINEFGIQFDRAWFSMNSKGRPGNIMNVRLNDGMERTFALGQGNFISVQWMKPDTAKQEVTAIVSRQISKKGFEYYLVRYDTAGQIKSETLIGTQEGDRELNHFKIISPQPGIYLLLGCYGQGTAKSSQKNKSIDESTGFFASTVKNGAQKSINFYNFLELQNVNSLLSEHDIMNLKKKALKKNKSLTEYSLDFPILLHEIQNFNDQYVIVAEVFAPQYHTENFTDFDYYGRPYTNSYSVFDGYRFSNAIVAGFNADGKLIWDNTIEIRNLVSLELSAKVNFFQSGPNQVLSYISDGKIGSKIIDSKNVVEKLDFAPVDLLYPEDKLLSEIKGRLVPWYGNYFISYGYQEIKNIALESNNKRLVFYFSKLRFEK